jgi:hypothetical protein
VNSFTVEPAGISVSSSRDLGTYPISNMTDEDIWTVWGGKQYQDDWTMVYNIGDDQYVNDIDLFFSWAPNWVPSTITISYSQDGLTWTDATVTTSGNHRLADIDVICKYIRVQMDDMPQSWSAPVVGE